MDFAKWVLLANHGRGFRRPHTPFPLGERNDTFDKSGRNGNGCRKYLCVTLDKSNRTEDEQVYKIGGIYNAKNDKCNGG